MRCWGFMMLVTEMGRSDRVKGMYINKKRLREVGRSVLSTS